MGNASNITEAIKAREVLADPSKANMTARVSVALTAEDLAKYRIICAVNHTDASKDIREHILKTIEDNAEILERNGIE